MPSLILALQVGTTFGNGKSTDDSRTLASLRFETGDHIDGACPRATMQLNSHLGFSLCAVAIYER